MLFVRVVSFRSILSMTHCQISLWSQQRKISVTLPALYYGDFGMYWHEVFLSGRTLWAGFISALKHFVRGQSTKACWIHLYLDVQGCPCSRARSISQYQLPSRAFTGTTAGQGTVRNKRSIIWVIQIHSTLQFLFFPQNCWFSNVSLPLSHDDSGVFFLFSRWKKGPAEGFHCMSTMAISGLQFCLSPLKHSALGEC